MNVPFIILFSLLFSGGALPLNAGASSGIEISLHATKQSVTIGDSLSLVCTVTAPGAVNTGEPHLKTSPSSLDIKKVWESADTTGSGSRASKYGFLLYAFSPDTLTVGPFAVDYTTSTGESGTIESDSLTIIVKGVVADPQAQPLPNRVPLEILSKGLPLWAVLGITVILILLVIVLLRRFMRRGKSHSPVPEKPIDEIGEFQRIRALRLHESGRVKELYILVSAALRGFIHRNMGFEAVYETTDEIIKNLRKSPYQQETIRPIREILEESDMVKFAKYAPSPEISHSVIDRALATVRSVLDEITRKKALEDSVQEAPSHKEHQETAVSQGGGI